MKGQIYRFIGLWSALLIVLTTFLLLAVFCNGIFLVFILLILVGVVSMALWFAAGLEGFRRAG